MPKILESEALTIARSIDQAPETDRPWMLDLLDRYQQQQRDEGEPDWPSVERARVERETNLRSMFEAPEKITYDPGPFSQNPQEAKMLHANMALLSARYQKEPAEVASRYDFLLNDYARQKLGASEDVDTAKFYALAQKAMQKVKLREDTQREGMSAALRGEDGVKALAAWQAKNADRAKDDAGLFMRGYQQALEQDGEMLPIADRLLPLLEAQASKKEGQAFDQTKAQELGGMIEQLAGMKKAQRKSVYRSIAARIEAAGYDQKGFWSQMLGELDKGLYRMEGTIGTSAGIASDVATAVAGAQTRIPDTFDGSSVSMPVLSDEEQQALLRQRDYRQRIGNVQQEIMQIVSGELDPVRPTLGWLNDTIETGAIKGPGAVAPFVGASAVLGPWGSGLLFTADFAEQNRRDLLAMGMDNDKAMEIGVIAAPLQAAVEVLTNMVQLGRFTKLQTVLARFTKPIGGGAGLAVRYAQNAGISLATEFTEEQLQDNFIVPAVQEIVGALAEDVPEVDWSFYKTRAANATPELAATLLPMALVFGGVMTAADAKLSRTMTQNVDLMMSTGMDQAQAVEVASQPTHEQRIKKGAELWSQRKGTKASMEEAQKKLAAQYRTLAADSAAAVKELEARGVLPRLLPMQGGEYRLTFNDGSTADFKTREEALGGIHVYIRDRMQRSTRALRETIDTLTKNLEQGREFALEISPEAMTADEAVKRGIISPQDLQERAAQGAILDATTLIENSVLTGKALGDEEAPLMLFGMSKNEWYDKEGRAIGMQRIKDDILRTTMKLWDGASPLTLIEEKTEGDAKVILSTPGKRQWMLDHLRDYEDASGDKLFTSDDNEQINDKQLIEAWSHTAQSYLVLAKDKVKGRTLGRYLRDIEEAELTAAMQGLASWWQAVVNRAQKLGELKAAGKLGADFVAELEKQLGIDSQVKHEQGAMQEAQNVANEVAQKVDTSGYSEANPGPNGETFSLKATVAAQANEPSPGGLSEAEVKDILADVDRERRRLEKQTGLDDEDEREEMGREKVSEYEDFVQERVLQESVELTLRKLGARSEGRSNKSEASYWSIPSLPTPEYDAEGYATNSDEWRIRVASHDAVYAISDTKIKIDLRELADPKHAILESVAAFNRLQKQIAAALANDGDVTQEQNNPATTVSGMDTRLQGESAPSSAKVNPESSRAADGTTSGYSEANPGPNGETFSIGRIKNGGRLLTFDKPIETPLGHVVSYEWQSDVIEDVDKEGEAVLKRVSDWDKAVANAETGRAIVHHFTVIQPDGSGKIVSLESALKATKGTETGKALNAAVKAARRLPLREAELIELEKLQADYDAAINQANSQGWRNAPEPELREPEFRPLAERGVKAVYVGDQFIKNLEPNELGSIKDLRTVAEWKKQGAVGQLQRPPYGIGDRIQTLRRLVKKDKALIDSASLFSSRAIPADDRITYSLRPGDFASRVEAMFSPFQRSPEARLVMARVAKDRALRLGNELIEKANVIRTMGSIDREARVRAALAEDKAVQDYLDSLTPAARQTLEWEPSDLKDDPLVSAMLDYGKLMSKTTAVRRGLDNLDEFEAVPWLPPSFYSSGAGITPGKMAKALYEGPLGEGGILNDGDPATLWAELGKRIEASRKDKTAYREAVQAFKDAKKAARDAALKEAGAWADNAKKQAGSGKAQRDRIKAWLRVLDGILAASPPEVRARVGGFVKMAGIATDEAALRYLEDRVAKLDRELEKWLKKEYSANIKKKLVKFGSDRGKRGVMEGRTIASVTEQIDYADDFSKMSKAAQDVQIDHLEAVISDARSTPEQVDIAIKKLGIAEAFYDFENQEAEALSAVSDWMNAITSAGRDIRKALDEDRREYLGTLRTAGITSILGVPQSSQTDANNRQENIKGSLLKQMSERVKGFINSVLPSTVQQLEDVFGVDSTVVNEFAPRIWTAANRSTDIKSGVEAQRRAMLATVFKTKSTLKQIAMLSKLQQSKMSGVFIKEGRKTETVTVPVDILERIHDGSMTAKAAGLTQAEADEALAQWAGASTRTKNVTIERETFAGTQKELQMSEMQALNYLLHWNQDAVRARMENHGWTQASIDQLNTFMSDETKAIGRWMSEMYATAGRALVDPVYRRIFHAPLPMVKNFAPTYYETPGNDSTMAIDAQQNTSGIMASFTKARRPHNYNVRQVDAMTAFLSHFEHVSHWVSFVELLRDMKAVMSAVEVQNAIIAHHGPAAAAALTRRINDTANQGNDQAWSLHEVSGWFNRINQARVFKALSWKISPVVKQTSAFFNPMLADVPAHAYTIGLSKLLTGKLDVEAMWNSDNIQRRVTAGFSAEARIAMQANGNGPIGAVAIKLMQNGMLPMQYNDAAWNTAGAAIAWDYYRGLAVESGQSAAMAEQSATKAVERMLATAAQPADLVNRSLVEGSSNPLVKGAWMFASESRKNLAIEFYAAKRLLTGKSKNKGMDAQRVIVAHVVMAMTTQLMSGLLALALGDDDDKEREWSAGEWAAAILAGPINGLFVVGDGLRYLSRLALGLRTFRSLPPYLQIVEDAGSAGSHIDDLFNGDDEEAMKELNRLSGSVGFVLSAMFGPAAQSADVVLGNPLRDMAKALND